MLRKIGFSIPDIKVIAEGGENTKSIIEAFIQQKQESVENDTLVLEKLKGLSFDTQITMDSLCTQLSSAAKNKQVPQEDLQLSKAEKMRREDYLAFAAVGLISPIIIAGGSIMIHELSHKHEIRTCCLACLNGFCKAIVCFFKGQLAQRLKKLAHSMDAFIVYIQ